MILFTGLGGLTGGALTQIMAREGVKEPVRLLSRGRSAADALRSAGIACEEVRGDLRDADTLRRAMAGADCVVHLAAKAQQDVIARAAAASGTVKRAILISSTSIFSKYYATQVVRAKEEDAIAALDGAGIEYTILRPTMIFDGKNDQNVAKFAAMVKKLPVMPIVGRGKALLQPLHKSDLADAIWRVMQNPEIARNQIYTVSGQAPMTLKEMLSVLGRVQGKRVRFVNVPMGLAAPAVKAVWFVSFHKIDYREKIYRLCEDRAFDHEKISRDLGYSPLPFEARLKENL